MNTDQIMSENLTNRVITRAKSLGYTVQEINPELEVITVSPANPRDKFLPEISQETNGIWKIKTSDFGELEVLDLEDLINAYQRAEALVNFLETLEISDLKNFS